MRDLHLSAVQSSDKPVTSDSCSYFKYRTDALTHQAVSTIEVEEDLIVSHLDSRVAVGSLHIIAESYVPP